MASGELATRVSMHPSADQVARRLGVAADALRDLRPAWPQVLAAMKSGLAEVWGSQGAVLGEAWLPISASWSMRKARKGFSRLPLVLTGKLQNDIAGGAGFVRQGKMSVAYGSRLPYARAIRFSSRLGKRAVLGWSDGMVAKSTDAANAYADQVLKKLADSVDGGKAVA